MTQCQEGPRKRNAGAGCVLSRIRYPLADQSRLGLAFQIANWFNNNRMVFNSITFLVFLVVVLLLYYRLGHRGQNLMLLLASYVFYGWWDYRFLALLVFTTLFDYCCALWIENETRAKRRRLLLASSMTVNLGVLCIFKYFDFFAQSLQNAFVPFGITLSFPMLHVVLPLGISFYTFLSMSYTIDVYRRELKPTRNPIDFMLYVAFFPHLVAGPIVRASVLLPQCQKSRRIIPEEVANGIWLILMGYVKKVVIADRLAQVVNWGFSQRAPAFADANSWLVLYAFAFQIYGDFSGYSDIARGLAKLMGFELTENFRAPYLVTNPSDFWRNWHISLSTWLRDYLYVPLGGNREGRLKTYRNLMTTMLLGGLWHGAGVAYVFWGLYHGALLACQRAWNDFVGPQLRRLRETRAKYSLALSAGNGRVMQAGLFYRRGLLAEGTPEVLWNQITADSTPSSRGVATAAHGAGTSAVRMPSPPALGSRFTRVLLAFLFFHMTCLGWLLFRAGSLPSKVSQLAFVREYLASMMVLPHGISPIFRGVFILSAASLFFQSKFEAMNHFSRWPTRWQVVGVIFALGAILALGIFEGSQFIYFQF
jgi:alginate O-acetyltransferase complex protein AlgI